ncbi:MAG: hypothetical protein M1472_04985 [Planctomycetes bacterium]|jgi:hypothetical protein|nr:hypothetical protein [Planctomycetota bacterium]
MTRHQHINDPFHACDVDKHARSHGLAPQDVHSISEVPAEILELLQRHAEELLRTSRETHRQSIGPTAAAIVDPWALAGTDGRAGAVSGTGNSRPADTLQTLLTIGEKLLARLESPIKNPFDFL